MEPQELNSGTESPLKSIPVCIATASEKDDLRSNSSINGLKTTLKCKIFLHGKTTLMSLCFCFVLSIVYTANGFLKWWLLVLHWFMYNLSLHTYVPLVLGEYLFSTGAEKVPQNYRTSSCSADKIRRGVSVSTSGLKTPIMLFVFQCFCKQVKTVSSVCGRIHQR